MPTLNIELLKTTLDAIKANPQHWNQSTWRCSSGMCFAGWAASLAGGEFLVSEKEINDDTPLKVGEHAVPASYVAELVRHESIEGSRVIYVGAGDDEVELEHVEAISNFAQDVLGLTSNQADVLFDGNNGLDHLDTLVTALIADGTDSLEDHLYDDDAGRPCGCVD